MKFRSAGSVRRFDLAPALDLLPAFIGEWRSLRFAPDGRILDPLTGIARDGFRLAEGRHDEPGARYTFNLEERTPPPPDQERTFRRQRIVLRRRRGTPADLAALAEQQRAARRWHVDATRRGSVTLHRSDSTTLAGELRFDEGAVVADVELRHSAPARLAVTFRIDVTSIAGSDLPRWTVRWAGRRATGTAAVDLAALTGGVLVEGHADSHRLRLRARVATRDQLSRWDVDAVFGMGLRGAAAPFLAVLRRRLRRAFDAASAKFWAGAETDVERAVANLHDLQRLVARNGGRAMFVRRLIWDSRRLDDDDEDGAR